MPPPRLICHIDMNSYFASVEQQSNPFLRGRPVGVCAYLHPRGCIIAASVEAKQVGVKVGMTIEEAKKFAPDIVCVQNEPSKYRYVTSHIFALLHILTDRIEYYSIDEAFLDLTGWYRDAAEAAFAMSRVKRALRDEVGEWLRCSVGIAPTRFLAKFASDQRKPDGLVVFDQENYVAALDVPVQEAWGIGFRMKRRLARLGIRTLIDLREASLTNLMQVFGMRGFSLWANVHGVEHEPFAEPGTLPKSIGHSYCVPRHISREGGIESVLTKLTERAGRRLRSHQLLAKRISIGVHSVDTQGYTHVQHIFPEPVDHLFVLVQAVIMLFRGLQIEREVDFLAVTLSELCTPVDQLFFAIDSSRTHLRDQRLQSVSRSVDHIRDRYGEESIVLGRMFNPLAAQSAPDRIGFRKTTGVAASEFTAYDEDIRYEAE